MSDQETTEEVEIDLALLSEDELAEFEAALVADFEEMRGTESLGVEDVSELKAIKETIEAVRAEMDTRVELSEADDVVSQVQGDAFLAKVAARKAAAAEKAAAEAAVVEPEKVAAEAVTVEPEAAAVVKAEASAPSIIITPKDLKGDVKEDTQASTGIIAAAGSRRYAPGTELPNLRAVAELFTERRPEVRGTDKGTDGSRYLVASVAGKYDEARTLGDDAVVNMEKIESITSPRPSRLPVVCAPRSPRTTRSPFTAMLTAQCVTASQSSRLTVVVSDSCQRLVSPISSVLPVAPPLLRMLLDTPTRILPVPRHQSLRST